MDVCSSELVCVLACTHERDARDLSLPAYFGPFLFALALNSMELLLGEADECLCGGAGGGGGGGGGRRKKTRILALRFRRACVCVYVCMCVYVFFLEYVHL